MFIGRYYHTLETNGRVSLPKTFREQATNWIITRGLDGGLFLFKESDFLEKVEELNQRTFTKKSNRDFIRLLTNEAQLITSDANGRVQLPEYLISQAQLSKQLVVVGSFDRIEIWDLQKYHLYIDQLEPQAESLAEQIEITTPHHD
ncbi:MAG: division/cell wall cluster transcriptional repressor MraZ [bacterium]|nr:division/cell wall cluster transcriptional repressor MraZ [bacterium]